jgi:outer membrane protein TolC
VHSQLATAEALVQLMTDRNASGVVARIDVLRQQVQLENARAALIATENELAKRRLQLARAVGLDAAQPFDLTDRVTFAPAPDMSVDEAVTRATSHRQDLRAAEGAPGGRTGRAEFGACEAFAQPPRGR